MVKTDNSDLGKPLGQEMLMVPHMKNNHEVLAFNRIFVSLIAGCVTGIAGVTGYRGFGVYLLAQLVLSVALLAKAGFAPQKYFQKWSPLVLGGLISSTELLTFILFWTLSNNIVYLF